MMQALKVGCPTYRGKIPAESPLLKGTFRGVNYFQPYIWALHVQADLRLSALQTPPFQPLVPPPRIGSVAGMRQADDRVGLCCRRFTFWTQAFVDLMQHYMDHLKF